MSESLPLSGVRMLLINDSNTIRRSGVAQAKLNKPDLVIMDVVMPVMNGFQATRAITEDLETQHIPVIICTTKDQETDKAWGMRQGAKDCVVKPIDAAELLSKIAALG